MKEKIIFSYYQRLEIFDKFLCNINYFRKNLIDIFVLK